MPVIHRSRFYLTGRRKLVCVCVRAYVYISARETKRKGRGHEIKTHRAVYRVANEKGGQRYSGWVTAAPRFIFLASNDTRLPVQNIYASAGLIDWCISDTWSRHALMVSTAFIPCFANNLETGSIRFRKSKFFNPWIKRRFAPRAALDAETCNFLLKSSLWTVECL